MNSLNTVTLDASDQQNSPTLPDSSVCVASLPENPGNMMHYEPVMDYWNEELSTAETGDMVLCSTGSLDWFVMLE